MSTEEHLKKGNEYFQKKEYKNAIEEYKNALRTNSKYYLAWHFMGITYHELGEYNKAIFCYQKALDTNPQHAESWHKMGIAYSSIDDLEMQFLCYENAMKINPDLPYIKECLKDKMLKYQVQGEAKKTDIKTIVDTKIIEKERKISVTERIWEWLEDEKPKSPEKNRLLKSKAIITFLFSVIALILSYFGLAYSLVFSSIVLGMFLYDLNLFRNSRGERLVESGSAAFLFFFIKICVFFAKKYVPEVFESYFFYALGLFELIFIIRFNSLSQIISDEIGGKRFSRKSRNVEETKWLYILFISSFALGGDIISDILLVGAIGMHFLRKFRSSNKKIEGIREIFKAKRAADEIQREFWTNMLKAIKSPQTLWLMDLFFISSMFLFPNTYFLDLYNISHLLFTIFLGLSLSASYIGIRNEWNTWRKAFIAFIPYFLVFVLLFIDPLAMPCMNVSPFREQRVIVFWFFFVTLGSTSPLFALSTYYWLHTPKRVYNFQKYFFLSILVVWIGSIIIHIHFLALIFSSPFSGGIIFMGDVLAGLLIIPWAFVMFLQLSLRGLKGN